MRPKFITGIALLLLFAGQLHAQNTPLRLKQDRDGAAPQLLSAAEFATLGDPLFTLLLKDKANLVKLTDLEQAIQPDATKRRLFVVSEQIVSDAQTGARRAVLVFDGTHGGEALKGNVMLSFSFGPPGPAETIEIEAWGWDNRRGRYNYYKLDRTSPLDSQPTWKFRISSDRADLLLPSERQGTCIACHVNGAPVMKELFLPWNNWHSASRFKAEYLVANSGHSALWPVATSERFKQSLDVAERLETDFIIPALKRFNTARLNRALKRRDDTGDRFVSPAGRLTVLEGKRLLRPLFETTEINLISSRDKSGQHPLAPANEFVPTNPIRIPDNFFLNTHLIAGGGTPNYNGLKILEANKFREFGTLTQAENKELLDTFQLLLNNTRGDTNFAWFVPEPSLIDNDMVDQLLRLGVITPHFLAAVLAIDLETPVFSAKRAGLLQFVPDQFEFKPVPEGTDPTTLPRDPAEDPLTKAVLEAIAQANPPANSPAAEFQMLLQAQDARAVLKQRVADYANRVQGQLRSSAVTRKAELERLYRLLVERRQLMRQHPTLKHLDETDGKLLLPLP